MNTYCSSRDWDLRTIGVANSDTVGEYVGEYCWMDDART